MQSGSCDSPSVMSADDQIEALSTNVDYFTVVHVAIIRYSVTSTQSQGLILITLHCEMDFR